MSRPDNLPGIPSNDTQGDKEVILSRVPDLYTSSSFLVRTDINGNVLKIDSFVEMPKQNYYDARFYRGDTSRTVENGGYGLGLSIAKTIVDQLGGDITAESRENDWTIFTFTLDI